MINTDNLTLLEVSFTCPRVSTDAPVSYYIHLLITVDNRIRFLLSTSSNLMLETPAA